VRLSYLASSRYDWDSELGDAESSADGLSVCGHSCWPREAWRSLSALRCMQRFRATWAPRRQRRVMPRRYERRRHGPPRWNAPAASYVGDLLIAAAALALLPRRRLVGSDVERVGWSLIFVMFVP